MTLFLLRYKQVNATKLHHVWSVLDPDSQSAEMNRDPLTGGELLHTLKVKSKRTLVIFIDLIWNGREWGCSRSLSDPSHREWRRGQRRQRWTRRTAAAWQIGLDASQCLIARRVEKVKQNDAICHRWIFLSLLGRRKNSINPQKRQMSIWD